MKALSPFACSVLWKTVNFELCENYFRVVFRNAFVERQISKIHVLCLLLFVFLSWFLSPIPSPLMSPCDTTTLLMDRVGTPVSNKVLQQAIIRVRAQPRTADWHFCHVNVAVYDASQIGFTVQAPMK